MTTTYFNSRFDLVKGVVAKLAREFDVKPPKLLVKKMSKLHGYYAIDTIALNLNTFHSNLSVTIDTVHHEFAHYLQDVLNLPEKKCELKAKRFEKNYLALGILPKTQKTLVDFIEE